jgi:hypothetical protein
LPGALAEGLTQFGSVNLGQPDLDLLFPDEDGQGVAIVDRYHDALGGGPAHAGIERASARMTKNVWPTFCISPV